MALTVRQLAVAALHVMSEVGSEGLTMKRLAAEVNRKPSSLYNHIRSRDDLIEHMRALIVEKISTASFETEPWDVAIEDWARSYLAAFAEHPESIRLLATTPITDPSTLEMYDVVIDGLLRGGWPTHRAVAVMRTVEAHVLGSALDLVAPETLLSAAAVPDSLGAFKSALDPRFADQSGARAAFELGIVALLAGLMAEHDRLTAASASA